MTPALFSRLKEKPWECLHATEGLNVGTMCMNVLPHEQCNTTWQKASVCRFPPPSRRLPAVIDGAEVERRWILKASQCA
ncbi:hypothetical protein Q7C36_010561 [Tachysurus vachellii]|uniref:Uncharacterized protein n=1 Tax=Tachysurus vachellii TaxID=175792 RepID=A0AA88MV70_TACVA|nr:hypothetical protein Q7C36_010561 [Tachysurus vachellii]